MNPGFQAQAQTWHSLERGDSQPLQSPKGETPPLRVPKQRGKHIQTDDLPTLRTAIRLRPPAHLTRQSSVVIHKISHDAVNYDSDNNGHEQAIKPLTIKKRNIVKPPDFVNLQETTTFPVEKLIVTSKSAANLNEAPFVQSGKSSHIRTLFGIPASKHVVKRIVSTPIVPTKKPSRRASFMSKLHHRFRDGSQDELSPASIDSLSVLQLGPHFDGSFSGSDAAYLQRHTSVSSRTTSSSSATQVAEYPSRLYDSVVPEATGGLGVERRYNSTHSYHDYQERKQKRDASVDLGQETSQTQLVSKKFDVRSREWYTQSMVRRSASTSAAYLNSAHYSEDDFQDTPKATKRVSTIETSGFDGTTASQFLGSSSSSNVITTAQGSLTRALGVGFRPPKKTQNTRADSFMCSSVSPPSPAHGSIPSTISRPEEYLPGNYVNPIKSLESLLTRPFRIDANIRTDKQKGFSVPAIMSLESSIRGDLDCLEVSEKRECWVVVEIGGTVTDSLGQYGRQGLEVVIVMDLSCYTSPAARSSMKTTISCILDNLSEDFMDTVAIVSFEHLQETRLQLSSTTANYANKMAALSNLDNIPEDFNLSHLTKAQRNVSACLSAALQAFRLTPDKWGQQNRHMIFFTSHVRADDFSQMNLEGFEDIHLHVIGCGVLYWPSSDLVFGNFSNAGWCFPSAPMEVTRPSLLPPRPVIEIRRFMHSLRLTIDIGFLKDLKVDILPGKNAKVTAILGRTQMTQLRPGERATILVQLAISQESRPPSSAKGRRKSPMDDLHSDLQATLGDLNVPVMTVQISYQHSHFPKSTTLSTTSNFNVVRYIESSIWSPVNDGNRIKSTRHDANICSDYIRKALIQKIVSDYPNPKTALKTLATIATTTEEKNLDYCDVVRELRYQIRRRDSLKVILRRPSTTGMPHRHLITTIDQDLCQMAPKRPKRANTSIFSTPSLENKFISEPGTPSSSVHSQWSLYDDMPPPPPPHGLSTIPRNMQPVMEDVISRVQTADTAARLWESLEEAATAGPAEHSIKQPLGRRRASFIAAEQEALRQGTEIKYSPWAM